MLYTRYLYSLYLSFLIEIMEKNLYEMNMLMSENKTFKLVNLEWNA